MFSYLLTQEEVDAGAILVQESVPVYPNDTEETLSERVKKVEHIAYPKALELVASEKATLMDDGDVKWTLWRTSPIRIHFIDDVQRNCQPLYVYININCSYFISIQIHLEVRISCYTHGAFYVAWNKFIVLTNDQ